MVGGFGGDRKKGMGERFWERGSGWERHFLMFGGKQSERG